MEIVIGLFIASLLAIVLVTITVTTGRTLAELTNYVDLDHANRIALDMMTRDVRQVSHLSSFATNSVTFMDKDGEKLTLTYLPAQRALSRAKGGRTNWLLKDCDSLRFGIFQRVPKSNSFDLIPVSQLTNCKVVNVTWTCSRSLFGFKANLEQGQTARIVIRNKKEE